MSKLGWTSNIETETLKNTSFRTTLFTGSQMQLTVMSLQAGEESGLEQHEDTDQFIRVEEGRARVTFGRSKDAVDETHELSDDDAVIIAAGTWHNVINAGDGDLKLYSLYSPPEHPDGTVHVTKAEAEHHS